MQNDILSKISEVQRYFQHNDLNLARRRLLDLVYDRNDDELLRLTLDWSKAHHVDDGKINDWIDRGLEICEKLKNLKMKEVESPFSLIKAESISKTYRNGFFSLKSVPMELKTGEIIGVVGENGNGKTTLLRSIAGYLSTDLNKEHYAYVPPAKPFHYHLKRSTGFIPQRIPKWYGKLIDNLRFSAAIHGIKGERNELMVDFVLERFGLSRFANLTWSQISSGYRTRFEIARIVLQRPAVIILDEPLANLDINAQQTLLQDLRFIAQSELHPMGVILTSQQLFEVEKVADKVLLIQKGIGKYNVAADSENQGIRVFEMETPWGREEIQRILGEYITEIRFNGGLFEIYTQTDPNICLELLLKNKANIRYYRDISTSTKRFF